MDAKDVNLNNLLKDPIKYAKALSVKDLENLVTLLKDYYYNTDTPLVPDQVYDQIEDALRERNPKSSVLVAIGAPVKDAVTLPFPMPSLNKAKAGEGTTAKWIEKYPGPYVVSHKIDGISAMWYRSPSGEVQLFTRGNGFKGQDITGILKYINIGSIKIPSDLKGKTIAIRGELIMSKSTWATHYEGQYPNVRNFVSGLANAKHPNVTDLRRVEMIAYQLMIPRMAPSDQLETLTKWGFRAVSYTIHATLKEPTLQINLETVREQGEYQIDGLVIAQDKINPLTEENPKHSIAFKSQSEEVAQTRVVKVVWKASKRYLLKPTVSIEPVFLSGGNLTKATGHNAKYVIENNIGAGAIVTIVRSGEVIPYIVAVNQPAPGGPDLPEMDYAWTEGGFDVKITEHTEEVAHGILKHMSQVLEIKHLGPGVLQKVIEAGYSTPAEVLNMTLEEWKEIPSLGKNAEKIWNSLAKLQTNGVWLSQLMDATSIFPTGIGAKKLQLVLDTYPDLMDMIGQPILLGKLTRIKGIERKTAKNIIDALPAFRDFLDEVPQIKIKDEESEESESDQSEINSELEGTRVVFTGVRDKELENWIKRSGGTIATAINKTHPNQILVAKDTTKTSNKLKVARDQGAQIYNLEEFKETYGYVE